MMDTSTGGSDYCCPVPECHEVEPHVHMTWVTDDPRTQASQETSTQRLVDMLDEDDRIGQLKEWWIEQARIEADKLAPKAVEYGSYDLKLVGQLLNEMTVEAQLDTEAGIVFYLLGKIARAVSAIRDGNRPADDTYVDIAIYAKMVLYVREHGRWP